MLKNYLIVHQSILPDYYIKVIETRKALEDQIYTNVKEACAAHGISRSTYYKYKDYLFLPSDSNDKRCATLSLTLSHQSGILSAVLDSLSKNQTSVLTISQSLPIGAKASVIISLDISTLTISIDELIAQLKTISGVVNINLVSIE